MGMHAGKGDTTRGISARGNKWQAIESVVARMHGANHPGMPAYAAFQRSRSHIAYAGYLGKQYDPFMAQKAARLPVLDLVVKETGKTSGADLFKMPSGLTFDRVQNRHTLLKDFDRIKRGLDLNGSMEALDYYHQQAADMVLGRRAQRAFDLSLEDEKTRERYGKHLWSQQVLLARRLVEAGVGFVSLSLGGWDTHQDNFTRLRERNLPPLDTGLSALLNGLDQKGLLDSTAVFVTGEFGRTPKINSRSAEGGRDHYPRCMFMLMAGGGIRGGQVVGKSDDKATLPASTGYSPDDAAASFYHNLGIDHTKEEHSNTGRPITIVRNGTVIEDLLS